MQCGCVRVSLHSLASFLSSTEPAATVTVLCGTDGVPVDVVVPPPLETPYHSIPIPPFPAVPTATLQRLMDKRATIAAQLQAFVSESMVKRDTIVSKFASMRAVLDSVERAALVAYDSEVRAVMKQLEIEAEGVEVLSQQLSAKLLAFGVEDEVCVDDFSVTPATSVDIITSLGCLEAALGSCWKIVTEPIASYGTSVLRAQSEVFDQLSVAVDQHKQLAIKGLHSIIEVHRKCRENLFKPVQGKLVKTLTTGDKMNNRGIAVNQDGSMLAVCNYYGNRVTLYALPSGKEIRVIGGKVANVQYPWKVCFTPSGHIIVTEQIHKKIHEITTTGGHHRYIGSENMLYMGLLHGVAANQDVVAVSDPGSLTRQIVLFSYRSGELLRGFGAMGTEPGQLSSSDGLCFSTDGSQVLVAESANNRVSVFSLAGEFVTSFVGDKDVLSQPADVCVTEAGQAVVANQQANNIVVISLKDGSVVKTVCADGVGDARFRYPDSIAYHAGKLYVLNLYSDRVHVFE